MRESDKPHGSGGSYSPCYESMRAHSEYDLGPSNDISRKGQAEQIEAVEPLPIGMACSHVCLVSSVEWRIFFLCVCVCTYRFIVYACS